MIPRRCFPALIVLLLAAMPGRAADPWLAMEGCQGPGRGKRVVLISGDEEYRSEEALTQLAKILAKHHGFSCTVLYAIDPATGEISPNTANNIPGLEALRQADLMVIATRFRDLPDPQMKEIDDYLRAGKPVVGMRTATHAFNVADGKTYAHYGWKQTGEKMPQGFGRHVLGETWINHHGHHGHESTRGLLAPAGREHPILRGINDGDIWGPSDVYGVRLPLPGDSQPLVLGQVLEGMTPESPVVTGEDAKKNEPMMPVAWVKSYSLDGGPTGRVFTTTMGAATDLVSAGTRRMLVNACYWAVGLESRIPAAANVDFVGVYEPTPFGFNGGKKGLKPADFGSVWCTEEDRPHGEACACRAQDKEQPRVADGIRPVPRLPVCVQPPRRRVARGGSRGAVWRRTARTRIDAYGAPRH